jgi:hypothetical protein
MDADPLISAVLLPECLLRNTGEYGWPIPVN